MYQEVKQRVQILFRVRTPGARRQQRLAGAHELVAVQFGRHGGFYDVGVCVFVMQKKKYN